MVSVEIIYDVDGLTDTLDDTQLKLYASELLARSGIKNGSINIIFVSNSSMTELNEKYKKGVGSTDVLTFNLSDSEEILEGEIYISPEKATEQAEEFKVSVDEELIRLATHGLLHLAGYLHNDDESYREMMQLTDTFVAEYFSKGV